MRKLFFLFKEMYDFNQKLCLPADINLQAAYKMFIKIKHRLIRRLWG